MTPTALPGGLAIGGHANTPSRGYLRAHERFALYLRVSFTSWGNHGITPLWCTCFGVEDREREVQASFDDARLDAAGNPNIPIRLKTGVERGRVIENATDQMREIGGHLLKLC